jgi:multimeric flavodoxin WrbA
MKILGISGSPRKGNTEWMVTRLLELLAEAGHQTEIVIIRKLTIETCNGCLACEGSGKERKGICNIKDDMQDIYPKLPEVDIIIMGTPVYFDMLSGMLKNFMDRTCAIWPKLAGKKLAGIAVAEEGIGKAVDNLKTYANICGMEWAGQVTAIAKLPRAVAGDPEVEKALRTLARKIGRESAG